MRHFINILENSTKLPLSDTIAINGVDVYCIKNPSVSEVSGMLTSAPNSHLRGLVDGDGIVIWKAFDATHFEVAKTMKTSHDPDHRFDVWEDDGRIIIDIPIIPQGNRGFDKVAASDQVFVETD